MFYIFSRLLEQVIKEVNRLCPKVSRQLLYTEFTSSAIADTGISSHTHSFYSLPRKALPVERDALEQLHMSLRSSCVINVS